MASEVRVKQLHEFMRMLCQNGPARAILVGHENSGSDEGKKHAVLI